MREIEERSPEETESGVGSVVWGWALWAAIILVFAAWAGVRSLVPDDASLVAGIESIAPAAGPQHDDPVPTLHPDADR
jgi:hypothetical protein